MMQEAIVTLIVFCALVVVVKRYAPNALKRTTRSWSTRMATKLGWHTLAAKITEKAEIGAACGTGCGSCGSCGSDTEISAEKESSISVDALKRTIRR
jgi:hypothetical protein